MRRTSRVPGIIGAVGVVAPLSLAGLLLAAPAYAASGITGPGDGVQFAADTTVRVTATLDRNSGSADLRLKSPVPGSSAQTVDTQASSLISGASLSYSFDTATCASFPAACSGRAEAPNGVWTVTLVGGGGTLATSTFSLKIPPRAPASLAARPDGTRAVVLSWPKGAEPDLTGWTLYADGSPASTAIGTDACSGTSCSTTVTYAADGTGGHAYSLVAHRRVAPASADVLDSPQSPQARATLSAAAAPSTGSGSGGTTSGSSPGTTATGAGGASGDPAAATGSGSGSPSPVAGSSPQAGDSTTGSGSTPMTVAQRRAFALSFNAFAPKLDIPKLPPMPDTRPAVAPLPDGSYEKTLGYRPVVKREKVTSSGATARNVTGPVGRALDSSQFSRSLAGALVMLLCAAHLRRWLGGHQGE